MEIKKGMAAATTLNVNGWTRGSEERAERVPQPSDLGLSEPKQTPPRPACETEMLNVRDVMTREVHSCRPQNTLAAAAVAMNRADCRILPVVDPAGATARSHHRWRRLPPRRKRKPAPAGNFRS